MPKGYIANPFRSGTVFQEGSEFGYYGKDIYGKFHQSPVLYASRAKAKEALDRQIINRGVYRMNPKRKKVARKSTRKKASKSPYAKAFFARRGKLIALYHATVKAASKAALLKKIRAMENVWVKALKKAKGKI